MTKQDRKRSRKQAERAEDHAVAPPLKKARNATPSSISAKTYCEEHGVAVSISGCLGAEVSAEASAAALAELGVSPAESFADIDSLGEDTSAALCKEYVKPTPVQALSWPIVRRGLDLVSLAQTGSGKTLAFGLPALIHAASTASPSEKHSERNGTAEPSVLVLLPTRELAQQVHTVLEPHAERMGVRVACVFGGVPRHTSIQALSLRPHILVATPGRLKDLADIHGAPSEKGDSNGNKKKNRGPPVRLSNVTMLVLDEADRMLDLGFEPDVRRVVAVTAPPEKRQTLMFSATWPPEVRGLASEFMRKQQDPKVPCVVHVSVRKADAAEASIPQGVTQHVEVIEPWERLDKVSALVAKYVKTERRILVFALYKKEAQGMADALYRRHNRFAHVAAIHGDMSQPARNAALDAFRKGCVESNEGEYSNGNGNRSGKSNRYNESQSGSSTQRASVLVATDVAARGIDVQDVGVVINATFPLTIEDYVHRIGRTGRAGKAGIAHTFFTKDDRTHAGELVNVLRQSNQVVPNSLIQFGTAVKRKQHHAYGNFFRDISTTPSSGASSSTAVPAKRHIVFNNDDDEEE